MKRIAKTRISACFIEKYAREVIRKNKEVFDELAKR